ncbi:hypothetical protein EON79_17765 [bacterium]|nr:MAG: hypothetical protein EON79_17765 [bacterium]
MIETVMEFALAGGRLADEGHRNALDRARTTLTGIFGPVVGESIRRQKRLRPFITPVVASGGQNVEAVRRLYEEAGVEPPRCRSSQIGVPEEPCPESGQGSFSLRR